MVARSPVSRGGAERRAALRRSACGEVVLGNISYLTSHSEKRSTYPRFSAASRSCSPALPFLYRRPGCLQLAVTCRQSTQHRPDTFLHTHSRLSFTHVPRLSDKSTWTFLHTHSRSTQRRADPFQLTRPRSRSPCSPLSASIAHGLPGCRLSEDVDLYH